MGPQVRGPWGKAWRIAVITLLLGGLLWFIVLPILTTGLGGLLVAGILAAFFGPVWLGIDLSQRSRRRLTATVRDREPVAYVYRTPAQWEVSWISSNAEQVTLWERAGDEVLAVVQVPRESIDLEAVRLPMSNFHQRPGLRLLIEGVPAMDLFLLDDRIGARRRLLGQEERQRAVRRLREGR